MTPDVADKLIARSVIDGACRRWTGAHNSKGYGSLRFNDRTYATHRIAYELWVGPIPEGYTIDHVYERGCRHKDCMEPSHLEAVTNEENQRRRAALITHCPAGHEYTEASTIVKSLPGDRVGRSCRLCHCERRRGRGPHGNRRGRPRKAA